MRPDLNAVLARRAAAAQVPATTGNVSLILNELRHALSRLVATGETTAIDLRSLPLTDADMTRLDAALGQGEVRVDLTGIGESQVFETRFAGVWRVTHFDTEGAVAAALIEVTEFPDILRSQAGDVRAGLRRLSQWIEAENGKEVTR